MRKSTKDNKRSQKENVSTLNADVAGILMISFGVFVLISILQPKITGILGIGLNKVIIFLMGFGAYIFPFLLIIIGYSYISSRGKVKFTSRFYGIILLIVNTLLFIHLMVIDKYNSYEGILGSIKNIYNTSSIVHGGLLSHIILVPIHALFGDIGSVLLFFSIYLVCVLIICEITISDIVKSVVKKKSKPNIKEQRTDEISLKSDNFKNEVKENDNSRKIKILNFMKNNDDLDEKEEPAKEDAVKDLAKGKPEDATKDLEIEIQNNNVTILNDYKLPEVALLNENSSSKLNKNDKKDLISSAQKLEETLNSFGVEAKVMQVSKGPAVTRYELQPSAGVKVSKIVNLSDDIALNLAASGVRIEAPIPGKAAVGIEVPNKDVNAVYLREVLESKNFTEFKNNLAFALGKDISGTCVVTDLTKMPHLLIAGATGSGKSVCINTLIISMLFKYSPEEVRLLMIDPKVVELSIYNGIPHLLIPVVTDPKKSAGALNWAVNEMTKRYKMFADNNVRNIEGYNELCNKGKVEGKMQWIVIIIDELADLMMVCPRDVEDYIARLAQMARAAGIHLVIATQRPSVDVITGVIKANIPSRISFAVSSQIDSRTILDSSGAEKLLGKGDMLYYPMGESKPLRVQGAFITEEEVEKVVSFIKSQQNEMEYKEEILKVLEETGSSSGNDSDDADDELINEAIRIVVESGAASTSLLQRRLRIGYNRAARMIEVLEMKGIISEKDGSKPRNVLISKDEIEEIIS
ncbi:MAG: DNA translocase FtsK 4TM domain-containing protein [Clostridiaceae bacterium]